MTVAEKIIYFFSCRFVEKSIFGTARRGDGISIFGKIISLS